MKNLLLVVAAAAIASVDAYIKNNCRNLTDDQLVKDFDLDDFSGQWFPLYQSKGYEVSGRCPVNYFERLQPVHTTMASRLQKFSSTMDHFQVVTSYKGMAGIVDNIKKYRGYFDKGISNGSLWVGATLKPLKRFEDNF